LNRQSSVKVAFGQLTPVMFDKAATVKKVCAAIKEAGENGAKIMLFPEAFVGGYPRGMRLGLFIGHRKPESRKDFRRYYEGSAIYVPGEETDAIGQAAAQAGMYVVIGVTEKEHDNSTLYCTALYFGSDGKLLGKHRKLRPSGMERLIWSVGDGSTLPVFDTPYGKIGAVICRESQMPLLRAAMYAKGVRILLVPTLDDSPSWQRSLRFIAHEGRCFLIACCPYWTKDDYPTDLACYKELEERDHVIIGGGSAIAGPLGEYVLEPTFNEERIGYAELDLGQIEEARFDFDPVGHYNRPDIFQLHVDETKRQGFFFYNDEEGLELPDDAEDCQ
jgi:nitrilase